MDTNLLMFSDYTTWGKYSRNYIHLSIIIIILVKTSWRSPGTNLVRSSCRDSMRKPVCAPRLRCRPFRLAACSPLSCRSCAAQVGVVANCRLEAVRAAPACPDGRISPCVSSNSGCGRPYSGSVWESWFFERSVSVPPRRMRPVARSASSRAVTLSGVAWGGMPRDPPGECRSLLKTLPAVLLRAGFYVAFVADLVGHVPGPPGPRP
jgi:hypothetical protein